METDKAHQERTTALQPNTDQELITVLTWIFAVRAVARQQQEEILTGVLIQQCAVVQAKVNN